MRARLGQERLASTLISIIEAPTTDPASATRPRRAMPCHIRRRTPPSRAREVAVRCPIRVFHEDDLGRRQKKVVPLLLGEPLEALGGAAGHFVAESVERERWASDASIRSSLIGSHPDFDSSLCVAFTRRHQQSYRVVRRESRDASWEKKRTAILSPRASRWNNRHSRSIVMPSTNTTR